MDSIKHIFVLDPMLSYYRMLCHAGNKTVDSPVKILLHYRCWKISDTKAETKYHIIAGAPGRSYLSA